MSEKEEIIIANRFKKTHRASEGEKEFIEEKKKKTDDEKELTTDETNAESDNTKRKKKIPKQKINPFQPSVDFLKNERFRNVFGLSLLLASVYMLLAFSSFLITWQIDQDKVMGPWQELFFSETDIKVDNWLGKLGAVISHVFIHMGFGVASFIFVFSPKYFSKSIEFAFNESIIPE